MLLSRSSSYSDFRLMLDHFAVLLPLLQDSSLIGFEDPSPEWLLSVEISSASSSRVHVLQLFTPYVDRTSGSRMICCYWANEIIVRK